MDLTSYKFKIGYRVLLSNEVGTVVRRCRSIFKEEAEYTVDFDNPMLGRRTVMESKLKFPREKN